jgi:hypothetical protein
MNQAFSVSSGYNFFSPCKSCYFPSCILPFLPNQYNYKIVEILNIPHPLTLSRVEPLKR